MPSRGLARLLAIPPSLRPVLLQAALIATSSLPPPALLSPTASTRCYSTRRAPKSIKATAAKSRTSAVKSKKTKKQPTKAAKLQKSVKPAASKNKSPRTTTTTQPKPTKHVPPVSSSPPQSGSTRTRKHTQSPPRALSFLPTPPIIQPPRADLVTAPAAHELDRATALFQNPSFLYSAPRFLHLPFNTRTPEVCLLGRSNVGKSTLINALAGYSSKQAGNAHGPTGSRKGIAITSARAGCTKTMNAYGFGPPLSTPPLTRAAQESRKEGGRSRSERRRSPKGRAVPRPEKMPTHSMVLMDMPGYGMNSREDWGTEILKYLSHREMLRGAVLLIDAVAGVKEGDRMVLEVLRDAELKTRVVLTKADKLVTVSDPEVWKSSSALQEMCLHVWDELRKADKGGEIDWHEGAGWMPEIFVTGAGDPKMGGVGVDGARLAVCRLAGHIAEPERQAKAPEPKIVPYDQLVFTLASESTPVVAPVQQPVEVQESTEIVGRGRQTRGRKTSKVPATEEEDPVAFQMYAGLHRSRRIRKQQNQASF